MVQVPRNGSISAGSASCCLATRNEFIPFLKQQPGKETNLRNTCSMCTRYKPHLPFFKLHVAKQILEPQPVFDEFKDSLSGNEMRSRSDPFAAFTDVQVDVVVWEQNDDGRHSDDGREHDVEIRDWMLSVPETTQILPVKSAEKETMPVCCGCDYWQGTCCSWRRTEYVFSIICFFRYRQHQSPQITCNHSSRDGWGWQWRSHWTR